eukprot:m51a1_g10708 hypothetical protein (293) ;mRNA; r:175145-179584
MDSIIQVSAHTHLIDAEVGPEDCLVIPSPVDGFVAVSLVSYKLEFSVLHQYSTLCRDPDRVCVSVAAVLLVLSGIIAGAGVVLEALWVIARDSRVDYNEFYGDYGIQGAKVGPGGCMVVPIPKDGYFSVGLVSSTLEFTVVNQHSTLCSEDGVSHWNIAASVSLLSALLLLSGGSAGAGAVLEALWFTGRNSKLEFITHTQFIDAYVGPEDCLVIPILEDGFVGVDLVSSKLEFSIVNQRSTLCRDPARRGHREMEAVSLNRAMTTGSDSRQDNFLVINALQNDQEGNETTR